MKILMLAPLPPPSGGIASWTVRYRDYCEKHGISLEIINVAVRGERASSETMKRSIKDELSRTRYIYSELKKKIREYKPDVLHINTSCSPLGILREALCVFAVHNRVSIVLHCRCNIEDQLGKRFYTRKVFEYLVKKAAKVIVLNKFSRAYVERIETGKSHFIPNFVSGEMVTDNHEIGRDIKRVIYVGHIEKEKGLVQIIDTARELPDIEFILLGAVREDMSAYEFPDNANLIGRVSLDEVQNYLKSADVFLFPSMSEGFSNALVEAMGMGLPVIASDVGANSEMIEDKGGIILKENQSAEIIDALKNMGEPEKRRGISEWNIKKVKTSYLIDAVMPEYMRLYASVVN